jgi:phosphate transport system substrate-binding protein
MRRARFLFLLLFLLVGLSACTSAEQTNTQSDSTSSTYIENKGSDTIVNLALAWAEAYQALHPEVRISVTGGGSGTGLAALANGTVDIANASRQIKSEEQQLAENAGYNPVEFVIARDAIAVIVHPENPINRLTLLQISQIFSGKINNWKELGGEDRPIVRVSRETNSGTHVYFLESVIRLDSKEDKTIFSADTLLLPSSEGIIAEVSDNPNAIGYDGLGYVTDEVKVLAVASDEGVVYIKPSAGTVNNGSYPIARELYMYTKDTPQGTILDYLNWVRSSEGQAIVSELGFVPYKVMEN